MALHQNPGTLLPSELILTERGTIYHLDLHPDQLADTIITVGDPDRVATVSRLFEVIEERVQHREFVTHTGRIGTKRITVVSTGIGPDNIDIVLNELDALVNIDFASRTIRDEKKSLTIVRLGTSGALQPDIPLDSVVVSTFAIGLDNLMHYYQHGNNPEETFILNEFEQRAGSTGNLLRPYIAESSIRLRNHFTDSYQQGITVSCPGFYGPQGRVLRGQLAYPQLIPALSAFTSRGHRITNFEMETSAIYGLGKLLGHQCLSLSTIIANRATGTFSTNGAAAVERMVEGAVEIVAALPHPRPLSNKFERGRG